MNIKVEHIIILICIFYILFLKKCNPCPSIETKTTIEYIHITDTIPEYIPKYKKLTDTFYIHDTSIVFKDTLNFIIDTNAILAHYFHKYLYLDTIDRDSIKIYITDEISNNSIISRNVSYSIRHKLITNNYIIKERNLFLGGGVNNLSLYYNPLPELGILYKDKQDHIFELGLGYNYIFNDPYIGFKIFYKIK
jgi:hypothetical protein